MVRIARTILDAVEFDDDRRADARELADLVIAEHEPNAHTEFACECDRWGVRGPR
jgi:hypothetical protein